MQDNDLSSTRGPAQNWTPRELRHPFVSILRDNGVRIEEIADMVGHESTVVTKRSTGTS
jgi:site-specific recombinase XerD